MISMKSRVLRIIAIVLSITIVALTVVSCAKDDKVKLPTPTERFFVNDFAAVLTEADANSIFTQASDLQSATTAQVVVVTVETLNGIAIEDYALELGRSWGVGDKEKDNGAVVLLSTSDREIYVSVGYGLEGALPDSKIGRIIDNYGIPYLSNDNFSAGLIGICNAVVNEIYIEYGIQHSENYVPIDQLPVVQGESTSAGKVIISWIILIVLVLLYMAIFGRRGGLFVFGASRFYGGHYHNTGFTGGTSNIFRGSGGSFGGGGAGRKF